MAYELSQKAVVTCGDQEVERRSCSRTDHRQGFADACSRKCCPAGCREETGEERNSRRIRRAFRLWENPVFALPGLYLPVLHRKGPPIKAERSRTRKVNCHGPSRSKPGTLHL